MKQRYRYCVNPEAASRTKSYMWLYRTGKYSAYPVVLFQYQETC